MKLAFATMAMAILLLVCSANSVSAQTAPPPVPNPVLYLMSVEHYTASGKNWVRHKYGVFNWSSYPDEMFAKSPDLPPCGANANSARTWLDFYDQSGKRLYGFCALGSGDGLNTIWFSSEEGVVPPSWVYIQLHDRKTDRKYKSNLAETTL